MTEPRYVLCVDDEPLVLEGLERTLRERFEVVTESKPLAALALLERNEHDFAAIISDMRMPLMDGAKFLSCAAEIAPNATRVLLTGHAELSAAIAAVNTGKIFRFLCKPCAPHELLGAVEAAAEQHALRGAEKQLLEQTLTGTVRLLSEVLSLAAPRIFTRTQHIQGYVVHMARALGRSDVWRFELAACLSMIGCVGFPDELLGRVFSGAALDEQEARSFAEHPQTTHRLLKKIPRFEDVADMILLQSAQADVSEPSPDVKLGARMLRLARDLEQLASTELGEEAALAALEAKSDPEDLALIGYLKSYVARPVLGEIREVSVVEMTAQMVLEDDVRMKSGVVIIPSKKRLTLLLLERLMRFSRAGLLIEPVRVRLPN